MIPFFVRPNALNEPGPALVAAHDENVFCVSVEQFSCGTADNGFKNCAMAMAADHGDIHRWYWPIRCASATCHVHADPAWCDRLFSSGEAENLMLDFVERRDEYNRLSCPIGLSP